MPLSPPPAPLRLSSRPALVAALCLGVGIVAADAATSIRPLAWLGMALGAAALAGAYIGLTRQRLVTLRPLAVTAAALVACAALGAARMAQWGTLPPDHVAHAARAAEAAADTSEADLSVVLWGTVADAPEMKASGVRFTLRADSALRTPPGETARGQRVRGDVLVTLTLPRTNPWTGETPETPVYPDLRPGDRIAVAGALLPARGARNPADFDYRRFLALKGVHATLRAHGAPSVAVLAPPEALLTRAANALRQRVRRALGAHVPSEDARAVLAALLVADRSGISEDTRERFVRAGLVHLLAVSGLHVLLVGFVLHGLLGPILARLGVPRRWAEWGRSLFTLGLLALYVIVTGAAVPVTRAFVMASVVLIGRALEKPFDSLNTLGVAALVLLLARPTALFEVGFQLSFSAVAALATLTPLGLLACRQRLPERLLARGDVKWAAEMTLASGAATLGTAPVLLVHFGRVPLAGLVLNLAAIPLTAASLGAGLVTVLVAPIGPLAAAFGALANGAALGLLRVSEWGARGVGRFAVEGFVASGWILGAMAAGLLALALWRRPRARWRVALGALALLVLAGWGEVASGDRRPHLDVVFLDVGQGDAALLSFPRDRHVLVDAGPAFGWNHGERTVLPHLQRFGIDRLDAVIATHPDADHTGGLPAVLTGVEVGRLVHNGRTRDDGPWARALHLADSLGIPQQVVASGDTLDLAPEARIRILAPGPEALASGDANEGSVALLVQFGETEVLLTGDAEAASEAEMVARYGPLLNADIATVGHHGSRTSSTAAFVRAARGRSEATWAVVSVAKRNRYGLPDEEPLARWAASGASVVSTAEDGAVWFRTDGRQVQRVTWR
ncbi:MAG: DNA internalization-related competence protein ComEC/Rec2 [Bacteroidota bacterium]